LNAGTPDLLEEVLISGNSACNRATVRPATPFTDRQLCASSAHNGSSSIIDAISPSIGGAHGSASADGTQAFRTVTLPRSGDQWLSVSAMLFVPVALRSRRHSGPCGICRCRVVK
jgi:hypothetical protein